MPIDAHNTFQGSFKVDMDAAVSSFSYLVQSLKGPHPEHLPSTIEDTVKGGFRNRDDQKRGYGIRKINHSKNFKVKNTSNK